MFEKNYATSTIEYHSLLKSPLVSNVM